MQFREAVVRWHCFRILKADFHFEQSVEKNDVDSSPIAEHYIFPLFYPTVEREGGSCDF